MELGKGMDACTGPNPQLTSCLGERREEANGAEGKKIVWQRSEGNRRKMTSRRRKGRGQERGMERTRKSKGLLASLDCSGTQREQTSQARVCCCRFLYAGTKFGGPAE